MAGLINQLIDIFESQIQIFSAILETSYAKKDAIIKNDIENLKKVTDEENLLVGKNSKIEKIKTQLYKDIAFVLNKKDEDINLTKLIELTREQEECKKLIEIKEETEKVLKEMKKINDQNQDLINISLEHIDFTMNFLRGAMSNEPYYRDSTGNEINENRAMFDTKQ